MSADMNQNIDLDSRFKFTTTGGALVRLAGALVGASLLLCGAAAIGEAQAQAQTQSQTHTNPPAATAARDPKASMSKFEARRIRHSCQERANEHSVKGGEREAFLTRCFFGRSALRGLRRDCAKQGAAKGLDRPALHDFVRECVKEQRIKQKLPE
jgi:hypothetical protein